MNDTLQERTRIAADILACKPEDVQTCVRAMSRQERAALTNHINGIVAWVADYVAAENRIMGRAA